MLWWPARPQASFDLAPTARLPLLQLLACLARMACAVPRVPCPSSPHTTHIITATLLWLHVQPRTPCRNSAPLPCNHTLSRSWGQHTPALTSLGAVIGLGAEELMRGHRTQWCKETDLTQVRAMPMQLCAQQHGHGRLLLDSTTYRA